MNDEDQLIAGWYGKIPSLGDFASRRLPTNFINTWDSWLQHSMTASREQLKERWLNLYLTGPIWRFTLMPGICGDEMWAGVLMPSVDKVGRYFPLTIAMPLAPRPGMMLAAYSAQTWYTALEQHALASLNINTLPEDLDLRLAKHPFPGPLTNIQSIPTQKLATWWQGTSQIAHKTILLPSENALIELFNATTEELLMATGSGKSIWWKVSPYTGKAQLHCFTGLPPENYFSALLGDDVLQ